ncbi:IclR family transcriptional regulator C-terminal domain-containing protein [Mesorhizobium sp. AR07]|uniref:IclR family transcriptional regulator C-terminal domain-containing protein n=1 Tax=Mesorhizobium sp. AR07 TaxID=2865838 RepID=UPI00215F50F5|nr:IclR family transcriptional regulator C-terminal domain-containing protein [Mesorhizobium sp. AR07]
MALTDAETRESHLAPHLLVPVTSRTVIDRNSLLAQLKRIADQGYAVEEEEFSIGLCCLAVPVEGFEGKVALGISVPTERFRKQFENHLEALKTIARMTED